MLSLETAKKLKAAGLKWEPQRGDWYYNHHGYVSGTTTTLDLLNEVTVLIQSISRDYANRTVHFAPRLDQLLAEIEKRGYRYILEPAGKRGETKYSLTPLEWDDNYAEISFGNGWHLLTDFQADSPTEAAASALLWILEGRANQ